MTTINLENGRSLGVYGDVGVYKAETGWVVNIQGPIVRVSHSHTMETLQNTTAVSLTTDDLPGQVIFMATPDEKPETVEYLQIAPGAQTQWILFEEDAKLTHST